MPTYCRRFLLARPNHLAEAASHACGDIAHEDRPLVGAHSPGVSIRRAQDLARSASPLANVVGKGSAGGSNLARLATQDAGVSRGRAGGRGNHGH